MDFIGLVTWTDIDDEQKLQKAWTVSFFKTIFEDEQIFEDERIWKCTKSHIEHFLTLNIPITWTNGFLIEHSYNMNEFHLWTVSVLEQFWKWTHSHLDFFLKMNGLPHWNSF
jgi:hypothetical protein